MNKNKNNLLSFVHSQKYNTKYNTVVFFFLYFVCLYGFYGGKNILIFFVHTKIR